MPIKRFLKAEDLGKAGTYSIYNHHNRDKPSSRRTHIKYDFLILNDSGNCIRKTCCIVFDL